MTQLSVLSVSRRVEMNEEPAREGRRGRIYTLDIRYLLRE